MITPSATAPPRTADRQVHKCLWLSLWSAVAERGALEPAPIKAELIRHLALGETSKTQLAKRYGVTQQAVSLFAQRHADRIARQREKLDDLYAGILYAEKIARVAELSEQVERVLALVTDPENAAKAGVGIAETERVVQTALRAIAEEKGELPSRTTVQHEGGVSVRYELVGINTGDLT